MAGMELIYMLRGSTNSSQFLMVNLLTDSKYLPLGPQYILWLCIWDLLHGESYLRPDAELCINLKNFNGFYIQILGYLRDGFTSTSLHNPPAKILEFFIERTILRARRTVLFPGRRHIVKPG